MLIARSKPRIGLGRAYMRGDMVEIGPAELRLRREEIDALASTWPERTFATAQLEKATLGWAAGLRLAHVEGAIDDATVALRAPDGLASDYVREELIGRSSPELRSFLRVTCWVPVLTESLCSIVAHRPGGGAPLTRTEIEALPLLPVASRPGALRYPPILAQALQREYRWRDPQAATSAICLAAEACRRSGELVTAVELFLRAGRPDEAAAACADLAASGEAPLRRIDELLRGQPELVPTGARWLPWRVRAAVAAGHVDEASTLLRRAEGCAPNDSLGPADVQCLVRARAAVADHHGDVAGLLACARQLLGAARPPAGGSLAQLTAQRWRLRASLWSGDIARAREALSALEAASAGGWAPEAALQLDLARAWLAWCEGDVTRATEAIEAIAAVDRQDEGDHLAELALLAGAVHRERNQIGAAVARLNEATRCAHDVVAALAASELARCHLAAGAGIDAFELVVATRAAHPGMPSAVDVHLRTTEARVRLARGDAAGAHALVRAASQGVDAQLLAARVALQQAPSRAAELVDAVAARSARQAVEKLLLRAQLPGVDTAEASVALIKAVVEGEPLGLVRTFLDEGEAVCRRIPELARESSDRALGRIAALSCQELALTPAQGSMPVVEELTARELTVLRMLPLRMSNHEMAAQMYISVNTLKTHVRAIYRKLDVPHRSAAVRRAKALQLV